ncbi:hypothetical protein KSS87_015728 [Heliosperma pusillum]|nr:hypothetical protein KSS87_015728 [Heliosperma pusillum]
MVPLCDDTPRFRLAETCYNNAYDCETLSRDAVTTCSEYGMLEVVDHNIPEYVLSYTMSVSEDFFNLPTEQLRVLSQPLGGSYMLYFSSLANVTGMETRHFWRDALILGLNSTELIAAWPIQPANLWRDVLGFSREVRALEAKILDLIARGLNLRQNYFGSQRLNESAAIMINRYPRCPFPALTCGMPRHSDQNLLTMSLQGGANGLQIWRNGEWKLVVPSRNALLVTVGRQMEVISNGILRAAEHRVVVNSERARTSISYFSGPYDTCTMGPAAELTRTEPPKYQNFKYDEFAWSHIHNPKDTASILPRFMK